MLSKKNRLVDKRSFTKVQKEGTLTQEDSFGMCVLDRGDEDPSRFGFIISNKIAKSAVIRNRTRRLMREGVRKVLGEIKDGLDVVFLLKKRSLDADTKQLENQIAGAISKANLIK